MYRIMKVKILAFVIPVTRIWEAFIAILKFVVVFAILGVVGGVVAFYALKFLGQPNDVATTWGAIIGVAFAVIVLAVSWLKEICGTAGRLEARFRQRHSRKMPYVLEPEFNPSWRMICEYELGNYGWMMRLAFFSLALSCLAIPVTVRPYVGNP
jgi:Mn2+/Fe2+ NRAMP family transporter